MVVSRVKVSLLYFHVGDGEGGTSAGLISRDKHFNYNFSYVPSRTYTYASSHCHVHLNMAVDIRHAHLTLYNKKMKRRGTTRSKKNKKNWEFNFYENLNLSNI